MAMHPTERSGAPSALSGNDFRRHVKLDHIEFSKLDVPRNPLSD